MESRLPKLAGAAFLMLLMAISQPVVAQQTPQPIWVTINATALGNYPGGDETFVIFTVNSAQPPAGNETITDMTLTAPFGSNFGIGLPATITPGQSLLSTIHLEIPSNFTQKTFVANLVVHAKLFNGTATNSVTITGSANVDVFAIPSQSGGQTTTSQTTTTSGISTTTLAIAVAIPSVVALILLVLLLRKKSGP